MLHVLVALGLLLAQIFAYPQASKQAIGSDVYRFVKFTEPNESAWTMLIPKGWTTEGGIKRVNPISTGDAANAIAAKLDFTLKSDAKGTVMMRWLPDMYYVDTRGTLVESMFPPGSRYNGILVASCPSAQEFLIKTVFPTLRPNATELKIESAQAQPDVVAAYRQLASANQLTASFQYGAALVTVTYTEGGSHYKEQLFTVIENMGPIAAGMWQNKGTLTARAPASEYAKWVPVGAMIMSSVRLNPKWVAGELKGQMQRTTIYQDVQKEIERISKEIVEAHQKANEQINHDMYLVLTGQEEYVNPYSGDTEVRPDGWKYHWQNAAGEVVVTNREDYSPNQDPIVNRTDYKRSKVKPRK